MLKRGLAVRVKTTVREHPGKAIIEAASTPSPTPDPTPDTTKMSSSLPLEIAETIQTASIQRHPSPAHDLNPSTAASQKQPVSVQTASAFSFDKEAYEDYGIDEEEDEEDIPYSVLKPVQRRASFPPLPDLRFEQSYLASIAGAETKGRVAWITIRDQVSFSCGIWDGKKLM